MARTFTVSLRGPAEAALSTAPSELRSHLLTVFNALENDPFVDNVTKFHYTRFIPAMLSAYSDETVNLVYQLVSHDPPDWEEWEIEIWSLTY